MRGIVLPALLLVAAKELHFIRHNLGLRVQLRYTPELLFELDTTIEYGVHIASLINEVRKTEGIVNEDETV